MDKQQVSTTSNNTVGSDGSLRSDSRFTISYLTLLSTLAFVGAVGNLLLIATISTIKMLRTSRNIFVVNLAVSGFFVSTFIIPINGIGVYVGEDFLQKKTFLCNAIPILYLANFYCSLITITFTTYDRMVNICCRHKIKSAFTKSTRVVIVLCLWILSFLLQLPNMIWDNRFDPRVFTCTFDHNNNFAYSTAFSCAAVFTPWGYTTVCFVKIVLQIRSEKQRVGQFEDVLSSGEYYLRRRQVVNSIKYAKTFLMIFIVFTICWAPYLFLIITDHKDIYPAWFHLACVVISYVSFSFNWIVFGVANQHLRRGYICFLKTKLCCKEGHYENDVTEVVDLSQIPSRF